MSKSGFRRERLWLIRRNYSRSCLMFLSFCKGHFLNLISYMDMVVRTEAAMIYFHALSQNLSREIWGGG
jgi:hypothetical protein